MVEDELLPKPVVKVLAASVLPTADRYRVMAPAVLALTEFESPSSMP